MSDLGDALTSACRSASITTGQGNELMGNWMSRGLAQQGGNRLGNSRAPPPTCNIPHVARSSKLVMPVRTDPSWVPKIAESILTEPGIRPSKGDQSSSQAGDVISNSLESTQDNLQMRSGLRAAKLEDADEGSQQEVSDFTEDDEDLKAGKAATPAHKRGRKGKEKKKVGRPIAYRGDPNAPELTDLERRRIKRRIANRESARRVRHKRQEELEDMQIKMEQIQAHNSHLQQHAAHIKEQKDILTEQLQEITLKFETVSVENKQLAIEIQALRQSLQLKMSALEDELDKRANEAEETIAQLAFGNPAQPPPLSPLLRMQPALANPMSQDTKACPSVPMDWFPSLNLDDFKEIDIVNNFFDDPSSSGMCFKREALYKH